MKPSSSFVALSVVVCWLSLLPPSVLSIWIPPELIQSGEFEPVHKYRERNGIQYNYEPENLHPEHCRYISEEECRRDDLAITEKRRRRQQQVADGLHRRTSESIGDVKLLILLVKFPEHARSGRELPPKEHFEQLCREQIKPYLYQQSYGQYNIQECVVQDWITTDNSEDFYAQGKSGLLGNVETQKFFHPALNKMDANAQFMGPAFWEQFVSSITSILRKRLRFCNYYD